MKPLLPKEPVIKFDTQRKPPTRLRNTLATRTGNPDITRATFQGFCDCLIEVLQSGSWVCDFSGVSETLTNCTVQCRRHPRFKPVSMDSCIELKCEVRILNFLQGGKLALRIEDQSIDAMLSYRANTLGFRNNTDLVRERLKNYLIEFPIGTLWKHRNVLIPCEDFTSELQKILPLMRDDERLSSVQSAAGTDICLMPSHPSCAQPGGPAKIHGVDVYHGAHRGPVNRTDYNLRMMSSGIKSALPTATPGWGWGCELTSPVDAMNRCVPRENSTTQSTHFRTGTEIHLEMLPPMPLWDETYSPGMGDSMETPSEWCPNQLGLCMADLGPVAGAAYPEGSVASEAWVVMGEMPQTQTKIGLPFPSQLIQLQSSLNQEPLVGCLCQPAYEATPTSML
jgi:hypothetical protein